MAIDVKKAILKVVDEQGLKSLVLDDLVDGELKPEFDKLVAQIPFAPIQELIKPLFAVGRGALEAAIDKKLAELQA